MKCEFCVFATEIISILLNILRISETAGEICDVTDHKKCRLSQWFHPIRLSLHGW